MNSKSRQFQHRLIHNHFLSHGTNPRQVKTLYFSGEIMPYQLIEEDEEEDNSFIMLVGRDHTIFKNRGMTLIHVDNGELITEKLSTIPDSIIVCDGCNGLIKDEKVGLLMLEEDHCWGTQCKTCVKKYFSSLPVRKG